MLTVSVNHILRRWLLSLSGILLGLIAAILLLLWLGDTPHSAQAFSPLPAGEGPGVRANADWLATVKDHLAQGGGITPASLSPSPTLTLTGETINAAFGASVATAGDVNGDGYSDVVVGAAGYSSGTGRIYVHPGTANGLNPTPTFTATGEAIGGYFGISVGTAGDVNGDGYADVIVGAYLYNNDIGRVYVYLGSPTGLSATPAFTATGEASGGGDYFGVSVATAGDVNADGYSDIVIGASGYALTGRAYVYLGSSAGLSVTPSFTATGDVVYGGGLGTSVASAGDVNGDGYGDVLVGAPSAISGIGHAFVYLGSASGLNETPAFTLTDEIASSDFGEAVSTAGDVNGDGYSDVVVGAPGYDNLTGRTYLYLSSGSGLSAIPVLTVTGEATGSIFGYAVATAGDVNSDGYADVIAGAEGYSNTGRAYIYLGSASGLSATPAFTATGETTGSRFGRSAATAGDVNGDGYADVIIGAHGYNSLTGRAYVYHGAADAKLYLPLISR